MTEADMDDVRDESDGDASDIVEVGGDEAQPETVGENAYQRAREDIMNLRAEYAMADEDKFFYIRQRGGQSNVAKVGRALDCAAMFARKGLAVQFCDQYGSPKQKSYHYSKYGGEAPANYLVQEFARKGHYFCCLWVAHECEEHYIFPPEEVQGLEESAEFVTFMCAQDCDGATFAEGMKIKNWVPRGPSRSRHDPFRWRLAGQALSARLVVAALVVASNWNAQAHKERPSHQIAREPEAQGQHNMNIRVPGRLEHRYGEGKGRGSRAMGALTAPAEGPALERASGGG